MNNNAVTQKFLDFMHELFPNYAHLFTPEHLLYKIAATVTLILCAAITYYLVHKILQSRFITVLFKNTHNWDDVLLENGFFRRLGHLTPAIFMYLAAPLLFEKNPILLPLFLKGAQIYLVLFSIFAVYALLNTIEQLYNESKLAERAPITGFIQVSKLTFAIIAILLTVSLLIDKSPLLLLSGLTAIAAILLLIFKDTILGFVAGIQIAANRMFNTGDWIEMQAYNVDGEIKEIGLNVVKIQNWDKTIATLPTYTLTNEVIKNWQGMLRSGGRRIKRSIHIDVNSVGFCDQDMLDNLVNVRFIKPYLAEKLTELQQFHNDQDIDQNDLLNARRLTNIGTFRAYMTAYLQQHPQIAQHMTLMVRQKEPSEVGIPLEVYCFSRNKVWVEYEGIQADIFDHFFAIMPLFGLRLYQRISDQSKPG